MLFVVPFSAIDAQSQRGKASFYSRHLTGRLTASGEKCTADAFTCAHRTYPFGTLLRVTNLDNGSEAVVRVNDRGPYVRSRVVDVSYAAAEQLGMLRSGTANVKVEELKEEDQPVPASLFIVDIAPDDFLSASSNRWSSLADNNITEEY